MAATLKRNIEDSIGVPHEILAIDNGQQQRGICAVYNEGAAKAKFEILCFMHEDIFFETNHWGSRVIKHLSNKEIGLIGVAGGDTKSLVPSSWPSSIFESEISLIQHFKKMDQPTERIRRTGYPEDKGDCKRVVCLDGVWLCTRKDVFDRFKFDDRSFNAFHGYDLDFSLQVISHYQVCVIFDITLHHYSEGSFNRQWLENAILLSNKWKKKLPISVRPVTRQELVRQHWTSMNIFIEKMIELNYSFSFMLIQFFKFSTNRWFHARYFLHSFKKIIFK